MGGSKICFRSSGATHYLHSKYHRSVKYNVLKVNFFVIALNHSFILPLWGYLLFPKRTFFNPPHVTVTSRPLWVKHVKHDFTINVNHNLINYFTINHGSGDCLNLSSNLSQLFGTSWTFRSFCHQLMSN